VERRELHHQELKAGLRRRFALAAQKHGIGTEVYRDGEGGSEADGVRLSPPTAHDGHTGDGTHHRDPSVHVSLLLVHEPAQQSGREGSHALKEKDCCGVDP
jgi:hypothetical protein